MANTNKKNDVKKNSDIDIELDDASSPKAKKATSSKGKSASGKTKATSSKKKVDSGEEKAEPVNEVEFSDEIDTSIVEDGNDDITQERNKYLRLAAEYDNFRKRSAKEREMAYTTAQADTIAKLLPVYDNLERALKMECADEAYYKGVEMTMTQLLEIFEDMGVRQIPAVGEPFDPNHHNAVMTIENPELGNKIVAEEFQKGFILGDKVIRFSTVVVAN